MQRHHILQSTTDRPQLAVSSTQLPANPTIVPGIPVRNIPQPTSNNNMQYQQSYNNDGEYEVIRRRVYPLRRLQKVEIYIWLLLALNNLAIYVHTLTNLDTFLLGSFLSTVFMMSFSVTQPSSAYVIYRRKKCVGMFIILTMILMAVSAYSVFAGYNEQLHSDYLHRIKPIMRWKLGSSMIQFAFAGSIVVKNILGSCNAKSHMPNFLVSISIITFLITFIEIFMSHRLRGIDIYSQLSICGASLYLGAFLLSGRACIVGSNSNRFISKLVVTMFVFGVYLFNLLGRSVWAFSHIYVRIGWISALFMGFLAFVVFEEIEDEMKNEGERIYNNRIPHDQYTV